MRLGDLAADIEECEFRGGSNAGATSLARVAGITADSREVSEGFVFAAISGTEQDGAVFIPAALSQGAVAILATPKAAANLDAAVPVLVAANPRAVLAELAARFYDHQPETICAVTGTNGKTSVASFLRQIWSHEGKSAASLGTLGVVLECEMRVLGYTTPDPVTLHRHLNDLALEGVSHVVLEASSHGLAQHRLDGVSIAAGALTNLSRDHLDYHADFDEYLAAKLRLFTDVVSERGAAVLNAEADCYEAAVAACEARRLTVLSVGSYAEGLKLNSCMAHGKGLSLDIAFGGRDYHVELPLMGAFQASNALVAAGLALATGSDGPRVFEALGNLEGAEGRVQLIGRSEHGGLVFVDYAHTPDALQTVLKSIRPHTERRLHVVFGAGGDRDKGKRPQMGRIATDFADVTIVTDDNPRNEDPADIRAEIMKVAPGALEIGDRKEAITQAIAGLESGDVLIVAGKGHESGQTVNGVTHPFKDADVVREILGEGGIL